LSDKDISVKQKSLVQLPYFYEEYEAIEEKQQPLKNLNNEMELDENTNQEDSYEKLDNESKKKFAPFFPKVVTTITDPIPIVTQTQLPPSIIDDLRKLKLEKEKDEKNLSKQEQSNQIRLEALKQRAQEKRVEKEKITQALRTETASNVIYKPFI